MLYGSVELLNRMPEINTILDVNWNLNKRCFFGFFVFFKDDNLLSKPSMIETSAVIIVGLINSGLFKKYAKAGFWECGREMVRNQTYSRQTQLPQ